MKNTNMKLDLFMFHVLSSILVISVIKKLLHRGVFRGRAVPRKVLTITIRHCNPFNYKVDYDRT